MSAWMEQHETLLWGLTLVSLVMLVTALVAFPLMILRLPTDYFVRPPVKRWPKHRLAVYLALVLAKNALGLVLLLAAVAMLVLPGQGLLMLLVSIMLLDFPRKQNLERWLIQRPAIRRPANWIRLKGGREPLRLPPLADRSVRVSRRG